MKGVSMKSSIIERQSIANPKNAENQTETRQKKEKQKKTLKTGDQSQLLRNPVINIAL
jgi:hypothetical protein